MAKKLTDAPRGKGSDRISSRKGKPAPATGDDGSPAKVARIKAEAQFEKATARKDTGDETAKKPLRDVREGAVAKLPDPSTLRGLIGHAAMLKGKVDEHHGRYRDYVKKAEEQGVPKHILKLGMALTSGKTQPDDLEEDHALTLRLCEDLGIAVQLQLFGADQTAGGGVEAKALADGFTAGRGAKNSAENPHKLGSEAHQLWMNGWHMGQQKHLAAFKKHVAAPAGPDPDPDPEDGEGEGEADEGVDDGEPSTEVEDAPLPIAAADTGDDMPKFLRRVK